jgi:hypothetical protein
MTETHGTARRSPRGPAPRPLGLLFALAGLALGSTARADDREILAPLFAPDGPDGRTIVIPPGDYRLDGIEPIPLRSHTHVVARGARFHFPDDLGERSRRKMFTGRNLRDFSWTGGRFTGRVFDPARGAANPWPPHANTRPIVVATTSDGDTANLTFRDITSADVAGAVITVLGAERPGSDREIARYATNVTVADCTLERSGKFMWDYGYLWQIVVWPEDFAEAERALAAKYFRNDLVRGPVRMDDGDDRVQFANKPQLPLSPPEGGSRGAICFFGDTLPKNVVRGRWYFVVESGSGFVRIAAEPGGKPIRFQGTAGPAAKLVADLFQAHLALYQPTNSGPGKGAIDLVGCEHVIVRGCRLSALGDTMHIQKCRDILFCDNQITGSRMGAFFLAEFCRNATITGNTVDGTNGSRVISVEKSCTDVAIVGNTFRGGGRGSWINQPKNLVIADNVFVNNTTKCEPDPRRGRRAFAADGFERHAEMYFTTHEPGGRYGNVIIRGNVFTSGSHATHALTFAPGGDTILVSDNVFAGPVRDIPAPEGCTNVTIRDNLESLPPEK